MTSHPRRELIPRDETLRLNGTCNAWKDTFLDAAQQWTLLTENGQVPTPPFHTELFQQAADAQRLSHHVLRFTADFAQGPHSTTRAGSAVLAHLATASTLSSHVAPRFLDAAHIALRVSSPTSPTTQRYRENTLVIEHATARAYLRRTSEALRDAVKELDDHLDLHRFFPTASLRQSPAQPPKSTGRHR
ncbi:hypothetical protein AB0F42_26250 [Streptomyces buecherae]|uniref:hypothetical protein n=1 Tax=Streptomyces buecherae TaxID=2763006 RepID=UPI0033C5EEE4